MITGLKEKKKLLLIKDALNIIKAIQYPKASILDSNAFMWNCVRQYCWLEIMFLTSKSMISVCVGSAESCLAPRALMENWHGINLDS